MTSQQAILKMTRGFNFGRCLETPQENHVITASEMDSVKAAGFNFVRLPVQWDQHMGSTAPYAINSTWLDRVQQIVDWAIERDLIIIINSHHDYWIDHNSDLSNLNRFKALWTQVSARFQNHSDKLFFEIINEPALIVSTVNTLQNAIFPIIRASNPTRIILFGGPGQSYNRLETCTYPANDNYLMGEFHTYEPISFAINGIGTWGTAADYQAVENIMTVVDIWSTATRIPVLLGEYGTIGNIDRPSRELWIKAVTLKATEHGFAPCIWSDFGNFSIYNPPTWSYVKDAIMSVTSPAPVFSENFAVTAFSRQADMVNLTWTSASDKTYAIDYSLDLKAWNPIATNISGAAAALETAVRLDLTGRQTDAVLVQYRMGVATPQVQNAQQGVAGSALTPGSGLNNFNFNYAEYVSTPVLSANFDVACTDLGAALANQAWISFSLTVGMGVADLDLTSLTFNVAKGGTSSPRGYAVRVTTPTVSFVEVQPATEVIAIRPNWGTLRTVGLSATASLQNLVAGQVVTFYIPVYAPEAGQNLEFDDITVCGDLTPLAAPPYAGHNQLFLRVRSP
jgi:hypothetical protein